MQGALEQLKAEVGDSLSVLAYHFSSPFTLAGIWDRANYYGVNGTPWVWFDGVLEKIGSTNAYNVFRNYFNQRKVIDSPLSVTVTLEDYDGSTGVGHVRAAVTNVGQSAVNAYLRLVATGDDSIGNWGYFTEVHDVALDIFPTTLGVAVALSPGQTMETVEEFLLPATWRNRACTVTGFVQDDATKEILQAGMQHEIVAIELASFTAAVTDEGVVLSWKTLSEEANAGFRVYRSDGGEYRPLFDGLIPGAGTTAVPEEYTYLDASVEPGATYWYKISDVSLGGTETFHGPIQVEVVTPELVGLEVRALPTPARESASLRFVTPAGGFARLCVFDVRGRLVRELLASQVQAGTHVVHWDLAGDDGAIVPPGQYACRLWVGARTASAKVVVTK